LFGSHHVQLATIGLSRLFECASKPVKSVFVCSQAT